MRLLIVKTSSMGDVVHALPAVSDILRAQPGAQIDWLVEPPFAAIPQLHPGVRRVLPLPWRRWRRQLWKVEAWRGIGALRAELRAERYDRVLDLQGLLKSALWARQARAPVAGFDRHSIREPLAAALYAQRLPVPRTLQAVDRCRRLAAAALALPEPLARAEFGLVAPQAGWLPAAGQAGYAVLIPNASRPEKLWPQDDWVAVGRRLREAGLALAVLWGSAAEEAQARAIAAGCGAEVPPFLKVAEAAALLAGARQVVGLDTGFSHLAAAFGRPVVGIYCDHDPGLAGLTGSGPLHCLGGKARVPARAEVLRAVDAMLADAAAMVPAAAGSG